MKRVNTPEKYLKDIVEEGSYYYIGFSHQELTDVAKSNLEISQLLSGQKEKIIVTGKKGPLRENTQGKLVRKQPEQKTSVWRHIEYYSERFQRMIDYDREFSIWEKEILHKFNLELTVARTPQGEAIFHFPRFKMENNDNHYHKAGAAMNMSIVLGKFYMLYDTSLEPIIPVTKIEDKSILPAGQYGNVREKLDTVEKNLLAAGGSSQDSRGNSYRFAILKELEPTDVIMGNGGFNEYLIFEFNQNKLLVFENLKTGNATYIFDQEKFDPNKELDKQTAKNDPSFRKRIIHENMDAWTKEINTLFPGHN